MLIYNMVVVEGELEIVFTTQFFFGGGGPCHLLIKSFVWCNTN
jgi:hypothetical protein